MKQDKTPWTMSVPAAGRKYYNLGRNAAYRAARHYAEAKPGEIPTVEVGGLKKAVRVAPRADARRRGEQVMRGARS